MKKRFIALVVFAFAVLMFSSVLLTGCATKSPEQETEKKEEKKTDEVQIFPATKPDSIKGKTIYSQNCVGCHGESGNGEGPNASNLSKKPANFTDLELMRNQTPAQLYEILTNGKAPMPSFKDNLSEEERWDVLYYVWSLATDESKLAEGKLTYNKNCISCHGNKGDGKGSSASSLNKKPANFTDENFMSNEPKEEFFKKISNGSDPMPGFKDKLSEEQRWNVIDYVWTYAYIK